MSIFERYQDLLNPEFVENYPLNSCPTVREAPTGMILDLDVAVALLRYDGHLANAAVQLQRSRRVIETYVQRDPMLSELLEDILETFLDDAEEAARKLARAGDGGMVKYTLSTLGKKRGYVTRTETVARDAITVQFFLPTNGRETPGAIIDGAFSRIPAAGHAEDGSAGESGESGDSHHRMAADPVLVETEIR